MTPSLLSPTRNPIGLVLVTLCLAGTLGCDQVPPKENVTIAKTSTEARSLFADWTSKSGLAFQHYSGASGQWHVPEILGSGLALFDYDSDGDLDVFFVQSSDFFRSALSGDEEFPLPENQPRGHRLFANQLIPSGQLLFVDVTEAAGLADESYGMGVAAADYDGDGDTDLYVTSFGENALYQNTGGTFEKQSGAAGAQDTRWSTSASFCDVNNDQLLDLYVSNYVLYEPTEKTDCRDALGQQDYCGPQAFTGAPDSLFINVGNGRFVDASEKWSVRTAASTGLGVVCRDFNQDGTADVYVANDAMPNLLWENRAYERFEEQGQLKGAAINVNGMSEGSMGIAVGDYDSDGDDDLFITHWNNETNTLYRNDRHLGFIDFTRQSNLASPSLSHTGFGTQWLDIDNDGDLDLFIANGAVQRYLDSQGRLSGNYGQHNQVFVNQEGRFTNAASLAGDATTGKLTGRGTAFGDVDNDGDTDVVVANKDGAASLFVNQVGQTNSWLGLALRGAKSTDALGATVTLSLESGVTLRRTAHTDGSYLSASDPRVLFGLGDNTKPQRVDVRWPSAKVETFSGLEPGRYHVLIEGAAVQRR